MKRNLQGVAVIALSLLLISPAFVQQPPFVGVGEAPFRLFAFLHEQLSYEAALCLEMQLQSDSIIVNDVDAPLLERFSAVDVAYRCRSDRQPIGTWHNHVAFALPNSGDGCFFSRADTAMQDSLNITLALLSCGLPGEPKLIYRVHQKWKEHFK